MFVDSKFNYAEVQRFFDEHVQWFFEDMTIYDTFASNHPIVSRHIRSARGPQLMQFSRRGSTI